MVSVFLFFRYLYIYLYLSGWLLYIAFFIPPKQEQSLLQGGTFVFDGTKTILAHYDESTAAHASIDQVIQVALEQQRGGVSARKKQQ